MLLGAVEVAVTSAVVVLNAEGAVLDAAMCDVMDVSTDASDGLSALGWLVVSTYTYKIHKYDSPLFQVQTASSIMHPRLIQYQGSTFLPNTKFHVFSRFLVLNSRFFVPNSRYFRTNFSYKNVEMC